MGRVVLSKEDIKKLDRLINMFEEQKKKFEKQKKEYQDGIIDCDSSTDIILYDAYIVLGKLIKKLPDVEGSDVFQDFVNVVLNDLLGDFSKLEDWCTQMLNTTSSLFNSVTENYNDMLDLDLLAEELSQMHNIPLEIVNIGNDSPKIMNLLSVMWAVINDQELSAYVLFVYKFMFRIISLWPQLSNGTSKIILEQVGDIYSLNKYKERFNKMYKEIPNLVPVDTVDKVFDSLDMEILRPIIETFGVMLQEKINNGTYNDTDNAIASSIVLICNQVDKCLESYMKADTNNYKRRRIRNSNTKTKLVKRSGGIDISFYSLDFDDDFLRVIVAMFKNIVNLHDVGNMYLCDFSGALDYFSVCAVDYVRFHNNGGRLEIKSYVPWGNEFSKKMINMSIDEKIDYYLNEFVKYHEEMIRDNGVSLVNVLKARMEQLDNTGVTNGDSLEQGPKGRTSR